MNRMVICAANLLIVLILGYLLIVGRSVLVPLVVALFVWNILNSINQTIRRIPDVGKRLPQALSMMLSFIVVVGFILIVVNIIEDNLNDVIGASARYHDNFKRMLAHIDQRFLTKVVSSFENFLKDLNVQDILVSLYSVFTTLASSAVLIALYVAFLFIEQREFSQKIARLFPQARSRHVVDQMLERVAHDIQMYLGLKTLLGLTTACLSWIIMTWVGLDFAAFWALLIFFLNYIPNIGAIIATLFPAVLALVQFQNIIWFVMMTTGLVLVQFVMGNIVEPRFLSRSLNLSPLVILFALGVWGAIWGVLGMFLSVPITVMMMIVFAHFEATRPIAIILSQNGLIQKIHQDLE